MSHPSPLWGIVAVVPAISYATDYLSVSEAQRLMFPEALSFQEQTITLTKEQMLKWQNEAGSTPVSDHWVVWAARDTQNALLGYVISDAVIGKSERINYAVGFGIDGHIRQVEILAYRETHGYEIRNAPWRHQFVGKDVHSALKLGSDIHNISGATLSCTHVTEGIRRLTVFVAQQLLHKT